MLHSNSWDFLSENGSLRCCIIHFYESVQNSTKINLAAGLLV